MIVIKQTFSVSDHSSLIQLMCVTDLTDTTDGYRFVTKLNLYFNTEREGQLRSNIYDEHDDFNFSSGSICELVVIKKGKTMILIYIPASNILIYITGIHMFQYNCLQSSSCRRDVYS